MMEQEGALTKYPPVDRIFGQHLISAYSSGTINSNPDTLQAGPDKFHIVVTGKVGHAAKPHLLKDPLVAALSMVRSFYDIYARELYFELEYAGVISVTYVDSGSSATNVVPDTTEFDRTITATNQKTMEKLMQRIKEIAKETASGYQCTTEVTFTKIGYPVLVNDPSLYKFFGKISSDSAINGKINFVEPIMGAEDYSFFANKVLLVFYHLGSGSGAENGQIPTNVSHHNSTFAIDETVLKQGAALAAHIVFQNLKVISKNS